ncbi:esterase-like activity of phytase family protein [Derxia gummosa]|uniref:Esterase-like activity of phytase family protein n=1 Tax=Derxia gummosa DSM 723 TaxID=1121388 RepID=A0A8B6XAN9_9BURK|nr:esterase-like activity of phytase family protein [Derxia gummosa]
MAGLIVGLLAACAPAPAPVADHGATGPHHAPADDAHPPADIAALPELRFLGEFDLPSGLVDGMPVGGLSGIDYDAARDRWVLVSDDRSKRAPARFLTARIGWTEALGLDVKIEHATVLLRPDGQPYTPNAIDPESIRMLPDGDGVLVASEGLRLRTPRRSFIDPSLVIHELDGRHRAAFELPANFTCAPLAGPRSNAVFEGTAVTPDGRSLWASLEAPLLEDDDNATPERGSWLRFTRFDLVTRKPVGQVVYPLSPLPASPWFGLDGGDLFPSIGVSEIAALDADRLIVLERSFVLGHGFMNRLFLADTRRASDTLALPSLMGAQFEPTPKQLLLDLDRLPVSHENLEGIAIGPRVKRTDGSLGGRLVVLVADDNFVGMLRNQFLAFELVEHAAER